MRPLYSFKRRCCLLRRPRFLVGSLALGLGFVLYQFGLSSELHQTTLLGTLLAGFAMAIKLEAYVELLAVILQFCGGLSAISGLMLCFSEVVRMNETRFADIALTTRTLRTLIHCKFCGAEMEQGSLFCPNCMRSQT